MRKLLVIVALPLLLGGCALPRDSSEEHWAGPHPETRCERWAGGSVGASPFDGTSSYDRQGGPYFAGPRLSFRDPYFRNTDPLKKDAVRECLRRETTG